MKKLLALGLVLLSVTGFAAEKVPSTMDVVDALAVANAADVALFLKSGNMTVQISHKNISADEEVYTLLRQSCSSNGLGPAQCLGGAQIEITIAYKRIMANRVKVGTSKVLLVR